MGGAARAGAAGGREVRPDPGPGSQAAEVRPVVGARVLCPARSLVLSPGSGEGSAPGDEACRGAWQMNRGGSPRPERGRRARLLAPPQPLPPFCTCQALSSVV